MLRVCAWLTSAIFQKQYKSSLESMACQGPAVAVSVCYLNFKTFSSTLLQYLAPY